MALRIEDYALIGNCETAALVGLDGSIDWLSMPRFDSAAFFAALLGDSDNGRWKIAPTDPLTKVSRAYREDTLVLETRFETADGAVTVIDCMGRRDGNGDVVRLVRGETGVVAMTSELIIRCDYGSTMPWVSRLADGRLTAVAGPDRLTLATPADLRGEDMRTVSDFSVAAGEEVPFVLTWSASFRPQPATVDANEMIELVSDDWREWLKAHQSENAGRYGAIVVRSLITLKALTHYQTGGIVAAPTTSLPEQLGGPRNWDYRFCWLRDATLTLYALLNSGFLEEAGAWRDWLLRAIAGSPEQMQIMYGIAGERRLTEYEVGWLKGYEDSRPVRIGNAASDQLQLDVFGEVIGAMYAARRLGLAPDEAGWNLEKALVVHLESIWQQPDEGIWEVRGGRRQFTASKAMAWAAFDRAIRSVEEFGLEGPVERWRTVRDTIHAEVCEKGFDPEMNSFTQYYGSKQLDASLLMMAMVGFLPATDPRVKGDRDGADRGRVRQALQRGRQRGRAVGRARRGLPALFVLARRQLHPGRAARGGARAVRTADRPVQRRRPPGRGI